MGAVLGGHGKVMARSRQGQWASTGAWTEVVAEGVEKGGPRQRTRLVAQSGGHIEQSGVEGPPRVRGPSAPLQNGPQRRRGWRGIVGLRWLWRGTVQGARDKGLGRLPGAGMGVCWLSGFLPNSWTCFLGCLYPKGASLSSHPSTPLLPGCSSHGSVAPSAFRHPGLPHLCPSTAIADPSPTSTRLLNPTPSSFSVSTRLPFFSCAGLLAPWLPP